LAEQFKVYGWQVQSNAQEPADVYVFNTCTVTEKADAEGRRLIRQTKRQHPEARIAVTGCYAQVAPEVFQSMEGVDFVIGNNYKDSLADIVLNQYQNHYADLAQGPLVLVDEFEKSRELATSTASYAGIERTRGSLKIQDGCDYKCTYCIIWQGRGPSRSLSPQLIVQQVQQMVDEGFKDIALTGINIGQYRYEGGYELPELLETLVAKVRPALGGYRLRLTSLDPLEVSERLMDVLQASNGVIAPHVHLSTQSANNAVLKRMARRHNVADLQAVCQGLVERIPTMGIGSDIIVGFPTETDEAFEDTYRVLEALPMHFMHVFRYSPRPGTPAATMKPQVPERLRKERAVRLIELANKKKQDFMQRFIGQPLNVLIERYDTVGRYWEGTSENYLKVRLPHEAYQELTTNQLVSVTIKQLLLEKATREGVPSSAVLLA
jgi:threonylcarbamoyladenosine tRNA methylthiotransferase MtaB